jgi:putative toxin-antitoxin system antitoxin component (TIGR02293 family)
MASPPRSPELAAIAAVLEISKPGTVVSSTVLHSAIEGGLEPRIARKVAKAIAPDSRTLLHSLVAKATLERRIRRGERLTVREGARLARAARIWARALAVWKSDHAARHFLFRAHPMLDDREPITIAIATEAGAEAVDQLLGRLGHSSAP